MARRTIAEQHMNWCRHFTGAHREVCKAGFNYRAIVGGEDFGWGNRLPCFADADTPVVCEKREFPTREEAEAEERKLNELFQQVDRSRAAIVAHANGRRGIQGDIPCPIDGGTLRFTIANVNGHIHAACSNRDCVRWME